ncbi:hypothetical protein BGZ92_007397 [Podila epicladia]|nr:hypothetical protein BGZ92_007397 [Podila epicladia]
MTSSSRLASDNHEDQPMDVYLDQTDTTYSRRHTTTTLIKEEQERHSNSHPQYRSRSTTLGGTSSTYHHSHSHQQHQQQQAEASVEIYRDPSPDAADSFDQHSHHHNYPQQQRTMDPDYGDQENIRPRPRAATVGDPRAQMIRDKDSSASSSSSSHPHHRQPALQRRPSAKTELLERSRPQGARQVSSSSSSQAGAHQQIREAHAPLVRKRSVYAMEEDSSSYKSEPLEQAREQLKQTHVGKSAAGAASRVDAPKKQRREVIPGGAGQQQQAQQNGGQAVRQRAGSSTQKQDEEDLTEEELKEVERKRRHYLRQCAEDISYGTTYVDSAYEYRNVILPKAMFQWLPRNYFVNLETAGYTLKLLSGLQMSQGWEHYMQHAPEPHIMPFRRDLETSKRVRHEQKLAAARQKKEEDIKIKTERP